MTQPAETIPSTPPAGSFWQRRVVTPIVNQLKQGITPEKIALTIALGGLLSVFPIIGATTILCALAAIALRLNQPIVQLVNYLAYPAQIALLIPFYRAGERLLGRAPIPLSVSLLLQRFSADPGQFFRDFGMIAVGGILVWLVVALPATALIYLIVRPLLRTLAARIRPPVSRRIIRIMSSWLVIGLLLMLALFAIVWAIGVKIRNYSFLDVIWSYGVAILAPLYALAGPGNFERKLAFTLLGTAWSLRLGTYIFLRVLKHHPNEDVRYEGLRARWPGAGMFLVFHEFQAVIVVLFSLPFLLAAWRPMPLQIIDLIGLAVVLVALLGESMADWQMKRFKSDPNNQGRVCETGLWHYSRHPNYFFEFLVWVGVALASLDTPGGWLTVVCPILMYYFVTKVTGIPLTEEYALKSKGDAYRDYQRTTSAFIPWFRKE